MASKIARSSWAWRLAGLVALLLLGLGGWYTSMRGKAHADAAAESRQNTETIPSVEIVLPQAGGIKHVCLQPGSIEPFEAADLYTKVSGFLIEQDVDIGYRVKEGQILAKIWVPEYETQVKQDGADVVRALAKVDQMKAAITTAQADMGAATASISLVQAEKKSKVAFREFRQKQRDRIQDLVARGALDAKLGDEQENQYQAAIAAELASESAVVASKQKEAASRARVIQAQADLRYADAEVETAKARLEKSQVMLAYTVIRSPYTGVVTKRNFCRGDFLRSADAGGDRVPVLAVERTDIMRVVVQVPERDVPFVDLGDPAEVEVDALPGIVYKTNKTEKVEVSRVAASEDPQTRMMRTEVHVKNADGKLRRGMYGRVAIFLEPGAPGALRIPSAAFVGKANGGKGFVRVVRDDKAYLVPVRYGTDNGSEVEILSGLKSTDRVILRANGPVSDGSIVTVANSPANNPANTKR